jgi:hypothetical protein
MKQFQIPKYDLGQHDLQHAFDVVFGQDTLEHTHGTSLQVTPWQDDERTAEFYVQIGMIPWALRHIFWASGLQVTIYQKLKKEETVWKVNNDIKMHFIGSRLFKIESYFNLEIKDNHVFLTGGVKCSAKLPLPINMIAESFMLSQCKKEIANYTEVVGKKFVASSKD